MSLQRGLRLGPLFAATLLGACATPMARELLFAPAPGSPIAVADSPGNVALGEVDQDGKLDLVVASGRGITVLLGRRRWAVSRRARQPVQIPDRSTEMVLRDLNGDGKLDLALANHDSYGVDAPLRGWPRAASPSRPIHPSS